MNLTCAYCGHVATKVDMIVSKATSKAYCQDELACAKRKSRAIKEEGRVRAN